MEGGRARISILRHSSLVPTGQLTPPNLFDHGAAQQATLTDDYVVRRDCHEL